MDNWISVKTALPTKNGSYLTTVKHLDTFSSIMILGFVKDSWYNYDYEYGTYKVHGVIAWQELPPLYKEEN